MPIPTLYFSQHKAVFCNKLRHSLTNYSGYFATDVCRRKIIISKNSEKKKKDSWESSVLPCSKPYLATVVLMRQMYSHTHTHTWHEIALATVETAFQGAHRHRTMPRSVAICIHIPYRTNKRVAS